MRTVPAVCLTLCLALLVVAARPAGPTFPELVARVEALERQVKALEAAQPPVPLSIDRAIRDGKIVVGMNAAQVMQALHNAPHGSMIADTRKSEEASGSVERWHIAPRPLGVPAYVNFKNGVVERVEYVE